MSFWDRIKPAETEPAVVNASLSSDRKHLALTWDDGRTSIGSARNLRQNCPCAGCVDEWTNKRTLDPEKVPSDLTIKELAPVGNYAFALVFSDGHGTGIYNWKHLRELTLKKS